MTKIRLLIADVDGTLVTSSKVLTERSKEAVRKLREAGIAFAVTSGRPPRGMSMLVQPLGLTTPLAAFNGGMLVKPDLSVIEERTLPPEVVPQVIQIISGHGLDVWVYRGPDWFVQKPHAPHVDHEAQTVGFPPTIVPSFDPLRHEVVKIVGVSDDLATVERCEAQMRQQLGDQVSASRSQSYYLDVTHPGANKGAVVRRFSELLEIPTDEIATIGDMPNDVLMFGLSGLSIAMGNASPDVQRTARRVTTSNDEEGFAHAVERFVLR